MCQNGCLVYLYKPNLNLNLSPWPLTWTYSAKKWLHLYVNTPLLTLMHSQNETVLHFKAKASNRLSSEDEARAKSSAISQNIRRTPLFPSETTKATIRTKFILHYKVYKISCDQPDSSTKDPRVSESTTRTKLSPHKSWKSSRGALKAEPLLNLKTWQCQSCN